MPSLLHTHYLLRETRLAVCRAGWLRSAGLHVLSQLLSQLQQTFTRLPCGTLGLGHPNCESALLHPVPLPVSSPNRQRPIGMERS